jgi:hypothetical protein
MMLMCGIEVGVIEGAEVLMGDHLFRSRASGEP